MISFGFCKGSKKLIAQVENFNTRNLYISKLIILNVFKLNQQFFLFEKFLLLKNYLKIYINKIFYSMLVFVEYIIKNAKKNLYNCLYYIITNKYLESNLKLIRFELLIKMFINIKKQNF